VVASMGRFTDAMTRRAKGPGALDFTALLRRREWSRVGPRLRGCATSREPLWRGAPDATARTSTRRDTCAEFTRISGLRHVTRSRARKNVLSCRPVSRRRKSRAPGGLARILFPRWPVSAQPRRPQGRPHPARAGRCAARRRPRAITDATTHGRGWRLDGRSG
jgi:hypothetical protein